MNISVTCKVMDIHESEFYHDINWYDVDGKMLLSSANVRKVYRT